MCFDLLFTGCERTCAIPGPFDCHRLERVRVLQVLSQPEEQEPGQIWSLRNFSGNIHHFRFGTGELPFFRPLNILNDLLHPDFLALNILDHSNSESLNCPDFECNWILGVPYWDVYCTSISQTKIANVDFNRNNSKVLN